MSRYNVIWMCREIWKNSCLFFCPSCANTAACCFLIILRQFCRLDSAVDTIIPATKGVVCCCSELERHNIKVVFCSPVAKNQERLHVWKGTLHLYALSYCLVWNTLMGACSCRTKCSLAQMQCGRDLFIPMLAILWP